MNIATVITVRLDSERLPAKAILDLGGGVSMLNYVLLVSRKIGYPAYIATADPWLGTLYREDCVFLPRTEDNVTERLYRAAVQLELDHIIRVTADSPFIDVWAAQQTVIQHLETGADFTHHVAEGRGIEVFTRDALEASATNARGDEQEHPDLYILNHHHRFPGEFFHVELMKFSVDTPEELELARRRLAWQPSVETKPTPATTPH